MLGSAPAQAQRRRSWAPRGDGKAMLGAATRGVGNSYARRCFPRPRGAEAPLGDAVLCDGDAPILTATAWPGPARHGLCDSLLSLGPA